jgi:hypothetical protein
MMRYWPLGASGLRVSELFLGAMTFADGFAHGAGRGEARRIVDAYAEGKAPNTVRTYTEAVQRFAAAHLIPKTASARKAEYSLLSCLAFSALCERRSAS